ncbi:MAG: hypothetical protein R3F43_01535 [bacterium]
MPLLPAPPGPGRGRRAGDGGAALGPGVGPGARDRGGPETAAGPFEVVLGPYPLALRDSSRKLRAAIVLTTDNPVTLRELRGRREQLRRMMYFLSAHRTEESVQGEAGKAPLPGRPGRALPQRREDGGRGQDRVHDLRDRGRPAGPRAPASEAPASAP